MLYEFTEKMATGERKFRKIKHAAMTKADFEAFQAHYRERHGRTITGYATVKEGK